MKARLKRRNGQTMVEYIIIVSLIAIALITLVGLFGKGLAQKWAAATDRIDAEAGSEAANEASRIDGNTIRDLKPGGSY